MKTYCKPKDCNIEDINFIKPFIHDAFTGKYFKSKFSKILLKTKAITKEELEEAYYTVNYNKILDAIDVYAELCIKNIKNRNLSFKPIRQFLLKDGPKERLVCEESAEQQIYEYIAKGALDPLFKAKILHYQYGSLPNRGCIRGKRQIERILYRYAKRGKKFCAMKCDIKKAYPSTSTELVMSLLRRDIHKNKSLLWLIEKIMSNYPNEKLLIGGYLPCWLFNYVMSYVLRYLMSHYKTRRGKKTWLIEKCVCYADDFIIFGTKINLIKALKLTKGWLQEKFNLAIKQPWLVIKNNNLIDMMGFKININNKGAVITTIRKRIFKKLRRQFIRANKELKTLSYIPFYRASKIISYWGFIKYSNSYNFIVKYDASWIFYKSKESVSRREKRNNNGKTRIFNYAY